MRTQDGELKEAKFAIMTFTKRFPDVKAVHLQMGKKMEGGTHKVLSGLAHQMRDYLIVNGMDHDYCGNLSSILEVEADFQSRL